MPDWTKSMQQTFEFYIVDPGSWNDKEKLDIIKSGTITRDCENECLGSASFTATETIGECYVRVYLVTVQNGVKERTSLGTFLCQTPDKKYDGKTTDITIDAYTPLIELKEKCPPIGYSIRSGQNVLEWAKSITESHLRAPVVVGTGTVNLSSDFVSNLDDTWLTYLKDLLILGEYEFALDELGRILFSPYRSLSDMRPVWVFDDGNSSILQPSVSVEQDLYGMPNVVEVVYSDGERTLFSRAENDSKDSPISTYNRGREIVFRDTNPEIPDEIVSQDRVDLYAKRLLDDKSAIEYTLSYTHGYCPVRIGDGVMLNYKRAGLNNVRARVTRQTIRLEPGCQVDETAVYSTSLLE